MDFLNIPSKSKDENDKLAWCQPDYDSSDLVASKFVGYLTYFDGADLHNLVFDPSNLRFHLVEQKPGKNRGKPMPQMVDIRYHSPEFNQEIPMRFNTPKMQVSWDVLIDKDAIVAKSNGAVPEETAKKVAPQDTPAADSTSGEEKKDGERESGPKITLGFYFAADPGTEENPNPMRQFWWFLRAIEDQFTIWLAQNVNKRGLEDMTNYEYMIPDSKTSKIAIVHQIDEHFKRPSDISCSKKRELHPPKMNVRFTPTSQFYEDGQSESRRFFIKRGAWVTLSVTLTSAIAAMGNIYFMFDLYQGMPTNPPPMFRKREEPPKRLLLSNFEPVVAPRTETGSPVKRAYEDMVQRELENLCEEDGTERESKRPRVKC